jgi:hypothetical protein
MADPDPSRARPTPQQAHLRDRQRPYLGTELAFRGGTCFHKLHIHPARRYSEDLDSVRSTESVTHIGRALGFDIKTKIGTNPKVYLLGQSAENYRIRIKIEVNTRERSAADPPQLVPYDNPRPEQGVPPWSGHRVSVGSPLG